LGEEFWQSDSIVSMDSAFDSLLILLDLKRQKYTAGKVLSFLQKGLSRLIIKQKLENHEV
jgi:hypothetical protein